MTSLSNHTTLINTLRVHIAPVGFEVDRIVIPALDKKADKVWLVTHDKPHEDKGYTFADIIEKKLKAAHIECTRSLANKIDLFYILRALRSIILQEKGNYILLNVSSGSKIQAIASMMACMMFKEQAMIKPYYVVPENIILTFYKIKSKR